MGIFDKREAYKPFEYPEVTKFTDAMSKSYWVHSEVEFTADIQDYKSNLTDVEREALKRSLLGIAQIEVAVKTFWGDLYKLFPKPEFNNLGMSFGESECFDKYTEILTNNGFKRFEDLTEEDKVAQYNMEDKSISFVTPLSYIRKPYKGKMHHYNGKTIDLMVTPNHEIIVEHPTSHIVKKSKSCEGTWGKNYITPVSGYKQGGKEFTTLDRLLIAIQADGSLFGNTPSGKESGRLDFSFTLQKERKIKRLLSFLDDLKIEYKVSDRDRGQVRINASLKDHVSFDIIGKIKTFSYVQIEDIDAEWGKEFLEELRLWDCSEEPDCNHFTYYNSREEAVDKVIEICSISGYRSCKGVNRTAEQSLKIENPYGDPVRKSSKTCYALTIVRTDKSVYPYRKEVDYDDLVYCVEVPTGCVVVRRNKSVCVSGNCRHSEAYARLLEVLGHVNEFEHILDIPVFKKRYHVLKDYLNENKDNIMEKLLFFTLVVENASLFSQFATILYFSRFKGYMKNVANMIAWSSTDEACLKLNTEVLTPQGWRFIKDMKVGDDIYGFKEGVLRDEKVLKTIRKPFEGSLLTISDYKSTLTMTPDHDVIYMKDDKWGKVKAEDFEKGSDTYLPKLVQYSKSEELSSKFTNLDFLKFIMSMVGERIDYGVSKRLYKYQVEPRGNLTTGEIISVLESLDIPYELHKGGIFNKNRIVFEHDFNFDLVDLSWVDFKLVDAEYAKNFIENLVFPFLEDKNNEVFSSYPFFNRVNADVVQRLGILAGLDVQFRKSSFNCEETIYELRFGGSKSCVRSDNYFIKKEEPSKEDVVCVTVPSGGIVVRQGENANPFIIGNCHAQAGTWILSKIFEEQPEFREKAEKEATVFIQEYIKMEDELLDWIFEKGELEKVSKKDLGNYMRYRLNNSFLDLKLKPPFELTEEDIKPMMWFEEEVFSNELDDFFAKRPTAYTKHDKSISENDLF